MNHIHPFTRLLAILFLVIPGIFSATGILFLKQIWFDYISTPNDGYSFPWVHFSCSLLMVISGISFIGGWIFYRDRKHNYVELRFRNSDSDPSFYT